MTAKLIRKIGHGVETSITLQMRPARSEQQPAFVNVAFVSHLPEVQMFYVQFCVSPAPAGIDQAKAKAAGFVEAPVVASIMCHESFIPKLIQALQANYDKLAQTRQKAPAKA